VNRAILLLSEGMIVGTQHRLIATTQHGLGRKRLHLPAFSRNLANDDRSARDCRDRRDRLRNASATPLTRVTLVPYRSAYLFYKVK